jgi:HPt (histidine-containing phosphotransfer) domain-containing protein
LRILALTASATLEDQERAARAGMDGHLAKPIDAARLLAAIEDLAQSQVEPRAPERGPGRPPAVDLVRALGRLQGNAGLLERIIVQFRSEATTGLARLAEALGRADGAALGYAAHRLRGQAASLDAEELVKALLQLERDGAEGRWPAAKEAFAAVERAAERVRAELAAR